MLKHILDALQGCFGPREKRTENALIPNDSQVWSASIVKRMRPRRTSGGGFLTVSPYQP